MIFMSDRLSVAFSFSRRAHLLTTCKAGGGIPPVGQARALFTKRLLAAFPEGAGNVASEHSLCSRLYICSISKTMRWHIATPSRRLPASTCRRQLDTDTGGNESFRPCWWCVVFHDTLSENKGALFRGTPFRKDKVIYGDLSFGG